MKLNEKLFANLRNATRSLMGQGPIAATAAIQRVLKGEASPAHGPATRATPQTGTQSGSQSADSARTTHAPQATPAPNTMRDINPPPASARARTEAKPTLQAEAAPQAEATQQAKPAPQADGVWEAKAAHAPQAAPQPEVKPAAPISTNPADILNTLMPELMANLERMKGEAGHAAFKMPNFDMPSFDTSKFADLGKFDLGSFDMPSFDLPGGAARGPAEIWPGKFVDGSFTNPAGTRSYKLYIPSTYTGQPVPLVVMLHGCTQDPVDFATGTKMNALAEEMQCLVVYPAQSQQANPQRCWNWFSAVDQQRDQGEPSIIAGITRAVMDSHVVDASQVYVAGLSAGGAMATIMGTLYPELYAAVGVHSGLPFASAHDLPSAMAAMRGNFGRQQPDGKSIPIIVFHGDKDTTVHPANGDELIARGKHKSASAIVIEPGQVPDGHAYTRTVHQHADGTPQAEQWLIHGAGHAWSGGNARGSYTDGKGPDASREMMRFFRTKR
jgi:poly(hydroxyalkanoate) depolymerase family esterase